MISAYIKSSSSSCSDLLPDAMSLLDVIFSEPSSPCSS
uniref:Uncharacterized protein n=1 Tax=Lotus japonicus TaxID=34305 RepID=I3SLT7_LOTJA|nr:unknown [Lotus japonicus]